VVASLGLGDDPVEQVFKSCPDQVWMPRSLRPMEGFPCVHDAPDTPVLSRPPL
jgi:hypothetical protein